MKTGYKTALIAVGLATILASQSLAQPGGRGRGTWQRSPGAGAAYGRPGGPGRAELLGGILRRLDLTEEQRDKIRDILTDARSDTTDAHRAVAEGHEALRDAVADGSVDAAEAAAEEFTDALARQAKLRIETMASVKKVLTEEQIEQLENVKERIGEFRERRGGAPRGRMQQRWDNRRGPAGPSQWQRGRRGPATRFGGRGPQSSAAMPLDRLFDRADADRDGELSRSELEDLRDRGGQYRRRTEGRPQRGRPGYGQGALRGRGQLPLERLFEQADTNDDSLLSHDELEAFRDKMNEQPRFRRR
jgi:Spy/CpxP family protein refolding chaperone